MPRYTVNATLTVPAWIEVEAANERDAEQVAAEFYIEAFDYDMSAAEVAFNVTPAVEAA